MTSILPFALIIVSLSIIIFIIVKRFPQLVLLDVKNLNNKQESEKKKKMLSGRIEKESARKKERWSKMFAPVKQMWKNVQLAIRKYVGRVEKNVVTLSSDRTNASIEKKGESPVKQVDALIKEGKRLHEQTNLEGAEKAFISAIRIDPRSVMAYRGLVDVYAAQNEVDQAIETCEFLVQVDPKNDGSIARLGELYAERGDTDKAIQSLEKAVLINPNLSQRFYALAELFVEVGQPGSASEAVRQAVHIEPENPKYLDLLVEAHILAGDQVKAQEALEQLRMANPANQKLDVFKSRISEMVDPS